MDGDPTLAARIRPPPLTEMICAENDLNFFNYVVVPIPQADKPDF